MAKEVKRCYRCKAVLPVAEFWHDKSHSDGLSSSCRRCKVVMNRSNAKNYHLRRTYGISLQQYSSAGMYQGSVCAICQQPPETIFGLYVDHSHVSGDVRGLLCHRCNIILGYCRDNPEVLRRAILYLENPPTVFDQC